MTLKELEEKLNKMTLEEFSAFVKKNYGKLLKEPKKLGLILKLYNNRVMKEKNFKKKLKNDAIEELMKFDLFGKGGDLDGK